MSNRGFTNISMIIPQLFLFDSRTMNFEDKSHFSFDGHLLFERLEVQKYLPFEMQIKEMIFSIL